MSTDVDEQVIRNTQQILGKYIKKPPLTEKLLRKPPFRFLHDIVNNIIRETGFLKGLYSERELVSENVKNKDDKIAFLNKLIEAIQTLTGTELAVRPSKVIAGFEPAETNLLLQAIGKAIDKKLDASKYIADLKTKKRNKTHIVSDKDKIKNKERVLSKGIVKEKPKIPLSKNQSSKDVALKPAKSSTKNLNGNVNNKSKLKSQNSTVVLDTPSTENISKNNKNTEAIQKSEDVTKELSNKESNGPNLEEIEIKESADSVLNEALPNETLNNKIRSAKLSKPTLKIEDEPKPEETPKPLNLEPVKSTETLETVIEPEAPSPKVVESHTELPVYRPRSALRPPSVRPSSARPGAPRLRNDILLSEGEALPLGKVNVILENFNNKENDVDEEEEETVVIQAAPEIEYQPQLLQMPTDKGHLVEQILEQINDNTDVEYSKPVVNIEWEQDALRDRNNTNKEVEQLRGAIQTLTRVANPLGKLINYLHEDIEAMHTELDMWNNSSRQIMVEVSNQKRVSNESNQPLQIKLEEIEENIIKHQQIIVATYGNILRNEERIRNLLLQ